MGTLRFVSGEAGKLAVEDGGEGGLPVVFVHGMLGDREAFRPQLEHARASRRAVALDLRGMGQSELDPQRRYLPEAFARDVATAADALALGRFVLAGHSYAGAVISAYAGAHPDRVAGLLYVDAVGDLRGADPAELEKWRQATTPERYPAYIEGAFRAILAGSTPEVTERVLAVMRRPPREVYVVGFEALLEFDPLTPLSKVAAPKHAIGAAALDGPIVAQRSLPGVTFELMEGVSHWLMLDRPGDFNERMDRFLDKLG